MMLTKRMMIMIRLLLIDDDENNVSNDTGLSILSEKNPLVYSLKDEATSC
jgi:hypothetical protein